MKNMEDLIKNLKDYYDKSLTVLSEFGGHSIYFHTQCIREQKEHALSDRHIELIYATLTVWGMHRMGAPETTKTKLVEFYNSANEFHIAHVNEGDKFILNPVPVPQSEECELLLGLIQKRGV